MPTPSHAQGTTTAAIRGTVIDTNRQAIDRAVVRVLNVSTGFASTARTQNGAFVLQGLAPGGPYRITAAAVGFTPQSQNEITLSLGEVREIAFRMSAITATLDTITVSARRNGIHGSAGGVGTLISDTALRRLPTLNRDLYDFVRLVPQAGTRYGLTGGGASFRYNSYVIDGISDRQLQGNNVMGASTVGGKTISIDAVKEVQVLLSPYDTRYGDFTGLMVNAVTRSGTNTLHGSAYGYARNENLARRDSFIGSSPYRREQFGFSLGGPIIRNRAHFFIAPEFQNASAPTPGPYIGDDGSGKPELVVAPADVQRFASLLRDKGIDAGDGSRVTTLNPAMTLFGRVDVAIPEWKSRAVVTGNLSSVDVTRFSRTEVMFPLTSNSFNVRTSKRSSAMQLFTQVSHGAFNELTVAYLDRPITPLDYSLLPTILLSLVTPPGGQTVQFSAGPPPTAGGLGTESTLGEIEDHLLLQAGTHYTVGFGFKVEAFSYHAVGVRGRFGQWRFSSLNDVASGRASNYQITKDFGGGQSPVKGIQPSFYVTNDWRIADQISLTFGLRAEDLRFTSAPDFNRTVDSLYNRRTTDYPVSHIELSPRFGFTWRPTSAASTTIRGGAGLFAGPPPLGWLLGPIRSTGNSVRTLSCRGPAVPTFTADVAQQPQVCTDGKGYSLGPVSLVDKNLRMAKSFRTSLAVERRLPWLIDASIEALYSRVVTDFLFVNANLKAPTGTDAHGRLLYGGPDAFGQLSANLIGGTGSEAIDLRNHSNGHSYSVSTQLNRTFSERLELHAAYTWSQTRDVQSLINSSAVSPLDIWSGGRPLSGRHDDLRTGVSSFEIPNRIVVAGTYTAPWRRWKTDISLYYIGESGSPFTYNDSSATPLGDLNLDGTNANDPVYVPINVTDNSEMLFESAADGTAFDKFISNTPCLNRQRGSIVKRNSCRGPWVSTSNIALRQNLQTNHGRDLSLQVELFNVLNLLNSSWGLLEIPNDRILEQKRQTTGTDPQPVFSFNASATKPNTGNLESGYQFQLSLRYSF